MVEAAMIFPLVIAGVAAVISIVSGMYSSLSLQTQLHLSMRSQCGESTETVIRGEEIRKYHGDQGFAGIRPVIRMMEAREYKIHVVFKDRVIKAETGRSYLIDEAELVRIMSLGKEES